MDAEFSFIVKPLLAGVVPRALASRTRSYGLAAFPSWMVVAMTSASSSVWTG